MINKYNVSNKKDRTYNGIVFDSKAEMLRYIELFILQKKDIIQSLKLQPVFILQDSFMIGKEKVREIKYIADFQYIEDGKIIIEDVKGKETADYLLKKKMFMFKYLLFTENTVYRLMNKGVIKDYKN